jgi:nucleotide-binding universal stress UspA family protein
MISKILVAVDGSPAADEAVKYAIGLAQQTGATITFLSVSDMSLLFVQSVPDVVAPTHLTETLGDYLKQAAEPTSKRLKYCAGKIMFTQKRLSDQGIR